MTQLTTQHQHHVAGLAGEPHSCSWGPAGWAVWSLGAPPGRCSAFGSPSAPLPEMNSHSPLCPLQNGKSQRAGFTRAVVPGGSPALGTAPGTAQMMMRKHRVTELPRGALCAFIPHKTWIFITLPWPEAGQRTDHGWPRVTEEFTKRVPPGTAVGHLPGSCHSIWWRGARGCRKESERQLTRDMCLRKTFPMKGSQCTQICGCSSLTNGGRGVSQGRNHRSRGYRFRELRFKSQLLAI